MDLDLELIQSIGFTPTVPVVFASASSVVYASSNALVYYNLLAEPTDSDARSLVVIADAPITALAGVPVADAVSDVRRRKRSGTRQGSAGAGIPGLAGGPGKWVEPGEADAGNEEEERDGDADEVMLAYAELGSTAIHLLGPMPQAVPLGQCVQRDTTDMGVAALAFAPRASSRSPWLLISINDLPSMTMTLWDAGSRTVLASLSGALSSVPRWLSAAPPPNHPSVTGILAPANPSGEGEEDDDPAASAWTSLRFAAASDDDVTLFHLEDTFRGPRLLVAAATDRFWLPGEFPGIDDAPARVSGVPAWCGREAVMVPAADGSAVFRVQHPGADDAAAGHAAVQLAWSAKSSPPLTSVFEGATAVRAVVSADAAAGGAPTDAQVLVLDSGDVCWARGTAFPPSDSTTDSSDEPLILARVPAPSDAPSGGSGTVHAVVGPRGRYVAVARGDRAWVVETPEAVFGPQAQQPQDEIPGLPKTASTLALESDLGVAGEQPPADTTQDPESLIHPLTHFLIPAGSAESKPISVSVFRDSQRAVVASRDGTFAALDVAAAVDGELGPDGVAALAPVKLPSGTMGAVRSVTCLAGSQMMVIACDRGLHLVEWTEDAGLVQLATLELPRAPIKIDIQYACRLMYVVLEPPTQPTSIPRSTSPEPAHRQAPPHRRGAAPLPSGPIAPPDKTDRHGLSSSGSRAAHMNASLWVVNLDTFARHALVTVDLPVVDAMWDSANDAHVSLLVLAREPAPAAVGGAAPGSVLYVFNVAREVGDAGASDTTESGGKPATTSTASRNASVSAASALASATVGAVLRIPDTVLAFAMAPAAPGAPSRLACCLTADYSFKVYSVTPSGPATGGATAGGAAIAAFVTSAHNKLAGLQLVPYAGTALVSTSADGVVSVRSIRDLDRATRVLAHDGTLGGTRAVACCAAGIVTVGADRVVRVWRWRVPAASDENGGGGPIKLPEEWAERMRRQSADAQARRAAAAAGSGGDRGAEEAAAAALRSRLSDLAASLSAVIAENAAAPSAEQLAPPDLLVNAHHAAALYEQGAREVAEARTRVLSLNADREQEIAAIKRECWDPMAVPGKVLEALTPGIDLRVANYPLRNADKRAKRARNRVWIMRKLQIAVAAKVPAAAPLAIAGSEVLASAGLPDPASMGGADEAEGDADEDASAAAAAPASNANAATTWTPLLFPAGDLVTNERRRMQIVMLEAHVEDLQTKYNARFEAQLAAKGEAMAKISERYDRMRGILEELGCAVPDSLGAVELGDGEVPDRVLAVTDAELAHVPKYLSEEEEARLAEQKRAEAERQRNAADDGRARALDVMMGGTLVREERATAPSAIPKPEVLETGKPKADWTEDDKRAVKEYEKRVATLREEQEKARKALETELRKLEASVDELRAAFDAQLQALLDDKLATDADIHMAALRALTLVRCMVATRNDVQALEELKRTMAATKARRLAAVEELPDIKAAAEAQKEVYEQLAKKDKEIERLVKREFTAGGGGGGGGGAAAATATVTGGAMGAALTAGPGAAGPAILVAASGAGAGATGGQALGVPMETVWKLFRRRYTAEDGSVAVAALPERDFVAGFTAAQWATLNELRLRKIQVEQEIKVALNKLRHTQRMAEALVNESEHLRREYEAVARAMTELEQHMLAARFDAVDLWALKQGQVEVPPAPVVTDYSQAVLIHRRQVEELNAAIGGLGKTKLEALREMRNYRRGILALEWETRVLEFQAHDVHLKTRDIQLLRVTKHMQEYLRSGDDAAAAALTGTLERQLEYTDQAFAHKLDERKRAARAVKAQLRAKQEANAELAEEVARLRQVVDARERIHALHNGRATAGGSLNNSGNSSAGGVGGMVAPATPPTAPRPGTRLAPIRRGGGTSGTDDAHGPIPPRSSKPPRPSKLNPVLADIAQRRQLVDLARAQAQDISVLSNEVQRWRLKTYPAFPAIPQPVSTGSAAPLPTPGGSRVPTAATAPTLARAGSVPIAPPAPLPPVAEDASVAE
ncbi:hypothetical protein H9P43_002347 [Blastocladiella emersonii ATCC 22665]|nr:hypothetical protein H9P43_002347 [Blastocladiella emersonii ATCC 22665]